MAEAKRPPRSIDQLKDASNRFKQKTQNEDRTGAGRDLVKDLTGMDLHKITQGTLMAGENELRSRKKSKDKDGSNQNEPAGTGAAGEKVQAAESKVHKIVTRVVWSLIMIGVFLSIVYFGEHLGVCTFIVILQTLVFRELVSVRYKEAKEKEIPWFRTLQWAWFCVAMFFSYGSSWLRAPMDGGMLLPYVGNIKRILRFTDEVFFFRWISFGLYAIVFVVSVLSFKPGKYHYQLMQFTWTLMTLMLVVIQTKACVYTIFSGMFWFLFPASLVVGNDCFAYIAGQIAGKKIFGNRVFLELSPNKTWEGFIGGFLLTHLYAFVFAPVWYNHPFFRCSFPELNVLKRTECANDWLISTQSFNGFSFQPIQVHALALAFFASVVAPFGGFFASAVKRAFELKDFDSLIPGHGGVTDRMDCQFIMSACAYVHYSTFVASPTLALPLAQLIPAAQQLVREDQQALLEALQKFLGVAH